MILGNGRVGKSSIVDALQGRPFDENKESSHAIRLERWSLPTGSNAPLLEYFIWDFGGQEIYHSTHRWFMSSRAVYLVVWDRQSEEDSKILDEKSGFYYDNHSVPYWINTIRSNNKKMPILLVENKLDNYNHQPKLLSDSELPPKFKQQLYTSFFSAKDKKRYLPQLLPHIQQLTQKMKEYEQAMPLSWYKVRQRILDCIFNETGKVSQRTIDISTFKQWCQKEKVLPKSVNTLLRFLHRTGIVYANSHLLKDTILLDQQWAINAIYKILDRDSDFFEDMVNHSKGLFRQEQLYQAWGDEYTKSDKQLFLQFMLSCQLCFNVSKERQVTNPQYAIPQLMPAKPSKSVLDLWAVPSDNVYYLEFQYEFLHYSTVQNFIVRMGRKTNITYIWKNGISIPFKGSHALVTADISTKVVYMRATGPAKLFLISAIYNDFMALVDKDLDIQIRVSNDNKQFIDTKKLEEEIRLAHPDIITIDGKGTLPIAAFTWVQQIDRKASL